MTDTPPLSTFQQKLKERREAEARAKAATEPLPTPEQFADLVPEADESYERSEDDIQIDRLIEGIKIDEAYDRWIRKPRPKERTGKREGVMISCPTPEHVDRNPSAWMNLDKGTWYCSGCDRGGDVLDLASFKFGIPNYKTGLNFKALREAIAEDFGFARIFAPGLPREGALVAPEPEENGTPANEASTGDNSPPAATVGSEAVPVGEPSDPGVAGRDSDVGTELATVSYLPEALDEEDATPLPGLAWRELVTPDTFIDAYMAACTVDDVPEEYHFWNSLLALGLAVGRDVTLEDYHPVLANLYVCVLGPTGVGKSRATSHLTRLLDAAIPEDRGDPASRGTRAFSTAGSAEVLIKNFSKPVFDNPAAAGGKPVLVGYAPVRGLVEYSELSGLIGRSARVGSTLKPTLMEFFDGKRTVSNASLSNGEQIAHEPFASLVTSTQPKALKTLLDQGDADSGFLNRWTFVTGTPKKRTAIGGERIDLTHAAIKLREVWAWADPDPSPDPTVIQWSEEAAKAFTDFFHNTIEPIKKGDGEDEREFYQRLDLLAKKLILLFTINEKLTTVPIQSVEKMVRVFWYLVKVLAIPTASIGQNPQSELEEAILRLVKNYHEKNGVENAVPLHYITKILGKKKIYSREMIERALKTLTNLNTLTVEKPQKVGPGRPPVARYRLATHE